MSFVQKLVRPAIAEMKAYSSARSLGSAEILLDANEFPWSEHGRYPEPQPLRLRERFAELYNTGRENVLICRGSDEAVDVLVRAFCEPAEQSIIVSPPTFEIYAHAAKIQGAQIKNVPLDANFDVDDEALLAAMDETVRLVFLCTPNNPTGNALSAERIERVLRGVGERALVVVDEAYVEFSGQASWAERLAEFPQLVVLRTLSKYWSAAGLRCGVALAGEEVIGELKKVLAPYPIAQPVAELVLQQLQKTPPSIETMLRDRDLVTRTLEKNGWVRKVWPSDANFLLVMVENAAWVYEELLACGVRVRDRSKLWPNSLRISLGNEKEAQNLLEALRKMGES